ncbi:hypothetical protein J3F84DRAFT_365751 [Trichoderma pleuroticola]
MKLGRAQILTSQKSHHDPSVREISIPPGQARRSSIHERVRITNLASMEDDRQHQILILHTIHPPSSLVIESHQQDRFVYARARTYNGNPPARAISVPGGTLQLEIMFPFGTIRLTHVPFLFPYPASKRAPHTLSFSCSSLCHPHHRPWLQPASRRCFVDILASCSSSHCNTYTTIHILHDLGRSYTPEYSYLRHNQMPTPLHPIHLKTHVIATLCLQPHTPNQHAQNNTQTGSNPKCKTAKL